MIATATNNGYFMWLEPYVFPDLENKNAVDTLEEYIPYQILYGQGFGYGSLLESGFDTKGAKLINTDDQVKPGDYSPAKEETSEAKPQASGSKTTLGDVSGAISAGTGAVAVLSEVFKGSDEKKRIRAACGAKPLFGADKKAKYQQCVQSLYAPQQSMRTEQSKGLSTSTWILIIVGILLLVGGTITFVVLSKKK